MERMEVITRTERRLTYSDAEKAAVVAEASVPGVTVREVALRLPDVATLADPGFDKAA